MTEKAPAFQFYAADFLSGRVATYSLDEIGLYTLLLAFDWSLTGLPLEAEKLARLSRVSVRKFSTLWATVSEQFYERDGRYYNPRLDLERNKQAEYSAAMSQNGKLGGRPPKSRGIADGKPPESSSSSTSFSKQTTDKPLSRPATATWLTPFLDLWHAHYGGNLPPGKAGKALGPVRRQHGDEVLRRWGIYLAATEAKYASAARFAETFGQWDGTAKATANGARPVSTASHEPASVVFASLLALIRSTPVPGQAASRHIRPAEVDALGSAARAAFDAVGGSSRFLSAEGDRIGYLLRDFEKAYVP